MKTVLITRPQPDADALATLLREKSFSVLVDPLFEVEFMPSPYIKKNYRALLATSRNAIRALVHHGALQNFIDLPLFTVGEETKTEALQAGFKNIKSADGSAASLTRLVVENCPPSEGTLLYLAGESRKPAFEAELASQGYEIEAWEIYAMRPSPVLHDETVQALRRKAVGAVLLFSERASMHFLQLAQALDAGSLKAPAYFCLSEQVAIPLREKGLTVLYPLTPSLHALIELLMQKNH